MMAVSPSSFFAFLLLVAHLVILNFDAAVAAEKYQPNCPESFNSCGSITGKIRFPFTTDTYPGCGLCTVSCSGEFPRIQLVRGQEWYQFKEIRDEVIIINLRNLISSRSCELFNYSRPLRSTPSISFNTPYTSNTTYTTFLKCSSNRGELDQLRADHFHHLNYSQYQGCTPGFTVYYRYPPPPAYTNEIPPTPPSGCTAIQLPMLTSTGNPNASDVFSMLDDDFSIRLRVSEQCRQCRHDGGQCSEDLQEFHCLKYGRRSSLKLIIGKAAAGIGVLVILLSCCCIIIRKLKQSECNLFWKNKTEGFQNMEDFMKNCGPLSPRRYTYSDVKRMTSSFQFQVGQGGYGRVYKGKLENGRPVAVKVLKELKGSGEEFMNEVATIGRTSHVNIVTLLGFCFKGRNRALIYEFMPNGSLEKFIHDRNSLTYRHLGWEALYKISVGIARGLEYLHRGCNTRIIHFDIKPHNILLDEDFCPKISDFGLAKMCPQKESIISLLGARGTAGYIAPEVFCRNFGEVSHKSDVYSYGMMVLEMVGGRKNIEVEVDHTSEIYFPHWIHQRLELDEELGLHGVLNEEASVSARKMVIAGLWCIQTNPSHRPAISRVVEMLEGSLEALQIPPKPYLYSPPRQATDCSTAESSLT